jgi:hypothetical protein
MTPPPPSQPAAPPRDDRYYALGQLVETAATMEIALRLAFCALMGGKYAAVVAAEQETHWLLETCDDVARHHDELPVPEREAIRAALRACREANRDRNRLVHDAWGTGADGAPATFSGGQQSYQILGRAWNTAQIQAAADAIANAQRALLAAIENALGPGSVRAAERLLAVDAAEHDRLARLCPVQ